MSAAVNVDRLARALDATGELVTAIGDDQWSNATPCAEWSVRSLVNHVVLGNWIFARLLHGEQQPLESIRRLPDVDQLGADPPSAYRESSVALQGAFSQPNVLERVFAAPIGTVPGSVLLQVRITEILVHGWDLARATGQAARLPDDLAEEELAFSRAQLDAKIPRSSSFGPAQAVADDAPAIDRLAAFLGRPVSTGPQAAERR